MTEKIDSKELIPNDQIELTTIGHKHELNRWKHIAAITLVFSGFLFIGAAMVAPYDSVTPYRDKAWTLFTVLVSSAAGYLYSAREDS